MGQLAEKVAGQNLAGLGSWFEKLNIQAEIQGMSLSIDIEKTIVLPDRQHVVQRLPFGEMTMVVDGLSGWSKSPRGEEDLSADRVQDQQDELASELLVMLQHKDELQCQALDALEVDGHNCERVYITGAGAEYVLLFIDQESELPYIVQSPSQSPMTQAPVTQQVVLGDYQEIDGFQSATSFTIKHDGEVFATGTLDKFEANPVVDEALFQK
jgi:hypothetical protein